MAGLVGFLNIRPEQPWILAVTVIAAAISVEGTVRTHPRWRGDIVDAVMYTLLPTLAVLGAGLFIDEAIDGYARVGTALAAGAAIGLICYGEYHTVALGTPMFGTMRLVLAVTTYLTAFALFTVFFSRNLELLYATAAVGGIGFALALELLRESRRRGPSSLLAALAIGISMAELRVALYYFPLDDLLAGALLIVGFYLATGIVHHLLDEDLDTATLAEYLVVAAVSAGVVVIARISV